MLGTRFNPSDSLHLLLGTRWTSWKSRGMEDYGWWNGRIDNDPTFYSTVKRSRFVPYAGLTWDFHPNHSLYASYTSIFDPNSAKDRNGNVLDPVLGHNYEIGWKSSWHDGRLNTALSLFQIDQKNRSISVLDPVTNRRYNEPVGHVRSRGLDAEVSGSLTDNWKLFAGYTYNRSKFVLGADTGSFTTGRNFSEHTPAHMFRLYTSYRLPGSASKWTVGGGISAQSRTNSLWHIRQGGYALFNANVQYAINDRMKLSLIGTNLTDRRVYENNRVRTAGVNNFYIEPRNVMLKFSWQMP